MKRLAVLLGVAGAIGMALGVFTSGASAADMSRVRVVHASLDAPAVDVYADGAKVLTNVAYKGSSDYLSVPAGTHNFKVFATGANPATATAVINADATLAAGKDYTVIAIGKLAEIKPLVLVDNNAAPAAGKAHVRVVHASPDAPAVDAGTDDLEVRAAGTMTVALPINGVKLEAGKIYTVFAVGLLNGTPKLEALPIVNDPAPAPSASAAPAAAPSSGLPKTGSGPTESGSDWMLLVAGIAALGVVAAASGSLVAVRQRSR